VSDPEISVDIRIDCTGWPEEVEEVTTPAVTRALAAADVEIGGLLELSVLLTGDTEQQKINRQWRGIDRPTNVLSFPQFAPFEPMHGFIGDLSLALETIGREAGEQQKSFLDHFSHLLVHGTLHLVGYDHENEDEALVMERLETEILAGLGIADPYDDRD